MELRTTSPYDRAQRRRARPWAVAAVVGLLVAAASVAWAPGLVLYLGGLGLAALGVLGVVLVLLSGRARLVAVVGTAVVVALAVLVPWRLAALERSGDPHWSVPTAGPAGNLYVDRSRLLLSDDDGLHAVDLADGEVLWSFEDVRGVGRLHVAGDGHVLLLSSTAAGDEAVWLSPDGDVVWRYDEVEGDGVDEEGGLNLRRPLASADGVLVVPRCDPAPEGGNPPCTYVGLGADGPGATPAWAVDGFDGVTPALERQEGEAAYDDPARLPEAVVVDSAADDGGAALVVAAADGATVREIDVQPEGTVAVSGGTVLWEGAQAEADGRCRSHGASLDGEVDWAADTPCLEGSAVVLGDRVYGVVDESEGGAGGGDRPVDESFVVDLASGGWRMVGGLALFNNDSDDEVGVPGAEVVVQRDQQRLTGIDPATGDELWQLDAPGDGIPGVSAAHGAAVVLASPDRGHNPFFADDDRTAGMAVLVVDTVTGDVTGRQTRPSTVWNSVPVGPGQAVVVERDEVVLIGTAPD